MKSRRKTLAVKSTKKDASVWLPIDLRILPDIFSFSHVRGIARFFLEFEIILATGVVLGTLMMTIVYFFG